MESFKSRGAVILFKFRNLQKRKLKEAEVEADHILKKIDQFQVLKANLDIEIIVLEKILKKLDKIHHLKILKQ